MKSLKYFLNILIVSLAFTGCQKVNDDVEKESLTLDKEMESTEKQMYENGQDVQLGDRITFPLTEGVTFDAVVEMPDIKSNTVSLYQVITQRYEGKELIASLIGSMPENVEVIDRGNTDYGYRYYGNLGEEWGNMNSSVVADEDAYIVTDHWDEISGYFPISYIGDEIQIVIDSERGEQELLDTTLKEASDETGQYLKKICGFEDVCMYQSYSFDWKQMKMMQENIMDIPKNEQAKSEEASMRDWKEEDNCYWMFFEQTLNQIPVLSHSISRQDDLYVPSSVTEVGYTQNGIEYIRFGKCYEILDEKKVELVNVRDIYKTLQQKFEMTIVDGITIDQMKLIYYPLPKERNEKGRWVCDMIPAWQFRVRENEYTNYIYINAVDNIELVG